MSETEGRRFLKMPLDSFFNIRESTISTETYLSDTLKRRIKNFFHYKKETFRGLMVCNITFIITIMILILGMTSKTLLYKIVYGDTYKLGTHTLIVTLVLNLWALSMNVTLFYGLKLKNPVLIFVWIITMLINWNVYVIARLVHLVDIAIAKESTISSLYENLYHLFPVIGLWLFMISIIWDYWQSISNITDIPELIDFLLAYSSRTHGHPHGETTMGQIDYASTSRNPEITYKNY